MLNAVWVTAVAYLKHSESQKIINLALLRYRRYKTPSMAPFDDRARRVRSPSFPFIPLGKAIVRARSIAERHGRHPVSLTAAGETWRYAPKSSGLLQTFAALRSYGLIEDVGRAEERKIQLSDLGWRILHDARSDARQAAIREAAIRPRSIAECARKWLPSRPSDDECISELHLDRGFSPHAAKQYLKVFDQTAILADLARPDKLSYNPAQPIAGQPRIMGEPLIMPAAAAKPAMPAPGTSAASMQISFFGDRLEATAVLLNQEDVAKFIAAIQATKTLLPAENQAGKDELDRL
jgi:hypothetical protein